MLVTRVQGTVLCDIILLNFLKGAEQYKAKKFEEVKVLVLLCQDLTGSIEELKCLVSGSL